MKASCELEFFQLSNRKNGNFRHLFNIFNFKNSYDLIQVQQGHTNWKCFRLTTYFRNRIHPIGSHHLGNTDHYLTQFHTGEK